MTMALVALAFETENIFKISLLNRIIQMLRECYEKEELDKTSQTSQQCAILLHYLKRRLSIYDVRDGSALKFHDCCRMYSRSSMESSLAFKSFACACRLKVKVMSFAASASSTCVRSMLIVWHKVVWRLTLCSMYQAWKA